MGRRQYRRRRGSFEGEVVGDIALIASKLSPTGALVLGSCAFALLYWLIPSWIEGQIAQQAAGAHSQLVEAMVGRRIRMFELAGIGSAVAASLVGLYIALFAERPNRHGVRGSSFMARVLARFLD